MGCLQNNVPLLHRMSGPSERLRLRRRLSQLRLRRRLSQLRLRRRRQQPLRQQRHQPRRVLLPQSRTRLPQLRTCQRMSRWMMSRPEHAVRARSYYCSPIGSAQQAEFQAEYRAWSQRCCPLLIGSPACRAGQRAQYCGCAARGNPLPIRAAGRAGVSAPNARA